MGYIRHQFEAIFNLGLKDESDKDLYHVQVINLTYTLAILGFGLSALAFAMNGYWPLLWFHVLMTVICAFGIFWNAKGQHDRAALAFPLFATGSVLVNTFIFFGSNSHIHWTLAILAVYAFTAFRAQQRLLQVSTVAIAAIVFVVCDVFASQDRLFLTSAEQEIISFLVFCLIFLFVLSATSLVVERLIQLNSHLRTLAEIDELTGLANRRKVLADAVNIFADAVMNNESCAFAILDLDHFKKINDTFGHEAGDLVLLQVAQQMQKTTRLVNKLGRYGGEEFIVIMPNTGKEMALQEMEGLRHALEMMQIETSQGIVIPITVSIGVSVISINTGRYEEILAEADKALYNAKREGRNRIKLYSAY